MQFQTVLPMLPTYPADIRIQLCNACFEKESKYLAACGHGYCTTCLSEHAKSSMEQEGTFPARCCGQDFVLHDIEKLLWPPHRRLQYAAAAAQFSVPGHQRVFCAKGCGTYLGPSTGGETLTCRKCRHVTCTECKGSKHDGECVSKESTFKDLVQAQGWQECANCKSVIELNAGCNHITYVYP